MTLQELLKKTKTKNSIFPTVTIKDKIAVFHEESHTFLIKTDLADGNYLKEFLIDGLIKESDIENNLDGFKPIEELGVIKLNQIQLLKNGAMFLDKNDLNFRFRAVCLEPNRIIATNGKRLYIKEEKFEIKNKLPISIEAIKHLSLMKSEIKIFKTERGILYRGFEFMMLVSHNEDYNLDVDCVLRKEDTFSFTVNGERLVKEIKGLSKIFKTFSLIEEEDKLYLYAENIDEGIETKKFINDLFNKTVKGHIMNFYVENFKPVLTLLNQKTLKLSFGENKNRYLKVNNDIIILPGKNEDVNFNFYG